MKPHITNLKHQKFCIMMEDMIQKMEDISEDPSIDIKEKIRRLKTNKEALTGIYGNYQFKLKELSNLLDEYNKVQQSSRIHLRKMQLWHKFSYGKLIKVF